MCNKSKDVLVITDIYTTYRLRACVIHRHSGPANPCVTSGHYIAHVCQGRQWYVADDTFVHKCTALTLRSGAHVFPYILFL